MKIYVEKRTICIMFLYLVLVCAAFICPYSEIINKTIAVCVLIASIVLIWQTKESIALLVLSIFIGYSNYSVVVGIYLFPDMRPSALYPQITDVEVYGIGIMMVLLFMVSLIALMPKIERCANDSIGDIYIHEENYNPLIFATLSVCFLFCIFYGYSWATIGRGSSSPLYEYAIIFLIIMFYYGGRNRTSNLFCIVLAGIYIMTSLLNGTRVEALECGIVFLLCMPKKRIPRKWLILGCILAIVLFTLVGSFRGDYSGISEMAVSVVRSFYEKKFVFDTCTHAYFPALCMIEVFENYNLQSALYFLYKFILSIFMGQSRVTDGDLISYVRKLYYHNYGGNLVGFAYVWFSYIGSLIFAAVIASYSRILRLKKEGTNLYKMCAFIYFISTVPRWYLYGPWPLFRGVAICLLVFWLVRLFEKILMGGIT